MGVVSGGHSLGVVAFRETPYSSLIFILRGGESRI